MAMGADRDQRPPPAVIVRCLWQAIPWALVFCAVLPFRVFEVVAAAFWRFARRAK